jgi:hypothetical protein
MLVFACYFSRGLLCGVFRVSCIQNVPRFFERFTFRLRQEKRAAMKYNKVQPGKAKNNVL